MQVPSDGGAAPKRRRLTGKTTLAPALPAQRPRVGAGLEAEGDKRQHWNSIYRLRVKNIADDLGPKLKWEEKRSLARAKLGSATLLPIEVEELKRKYAAVFEQEVGLYEYAVRRAAGEDFRKCPKSFSAAPALPQSAFDSVLFTLQGDWGLFKSFAVSLPPGCSKAPLAYLSEIVVWLRAQKRFAWLQRSFTDWCEKVQALLHGTAMSWALELCAVSLVADSVVRVHGHVFIHSYVKMAFGADDAALPPKFLGVTFPHVRVGFAKVKGRNREDGFNAGHFYCVADKIGSVVSGSTLVLYESIAVKPQWIQALYFKGKATVLATKRALLRCGYQAEAYVKNLEFVVAAQKKDVLSERIVELERELRAGLKPPRKLQAAEERWLPQYAQKLLRYKLLVLEGSSCVGKTVWARFLAVPGHVLELNCASARFANFRDYDPDVHEVCILDEASPELILTERKLFQAGPQLVDLGNSTTGCYTYSVWVWRLKMVVCSNRWSRQLEALAPDDKAWIEANSVHIPVTTQLWE